MTEPQSDDAWGPDDVWETGAAIDFRETDGAFVLQANAAGLRTLARMLLDLAERPPGAHQHLEEWSGLNIGSLPIILQHGVLQQE